MTQVTQWNLKEWGGKYSSKAFNHLGHKEHDSGFMKG